jgi:hypothetical protein
MADYDSGVRLRLRFSKADADALEHLAQANGLTTTALVHTWLYQALNNRAPSEAPNARNNNEHPAYR